MSVGSLDASERRAEKLRQQNDALLKQIESDSSRPAVTEEHNDSFGPPDEKLPDL